MHIENSSFSLMPNVRTEMHVSDKKVMFSALNIHAYNKTGLSMLDNLQLDLDTVPLKRFAYGVCQHLMPLRKDGAIRVHGLVGHSCPGFGRAPCCVLTARHQHVFFSSQGLDVIILSSGPQVLRPIESSIVDHSRNHFQLLFPGRLIRVILKASRGHVAVMLAAILNQLFGSSDTRSWERLLRFPGKSLRVLERDHHWNWNLSIHITQ